MIKIHGLVLAIVTEDPENLTEGQVWYNSTDDQIKFFDHNSVIQSINDMYRGSTPPLNSVELVWLNTNNNILYTYDNEKEKWFSIQKESVDFIADNILYSGQLHGKKYIRYPATITGIKSTSTDKTFIIQADGIDLYQFATPVDTSSLSIDIDEGSVLSCSTSTNIKNGSQVYIRNINVNVEWLWRYS